MHVDDVAGSIWQTLGGGGQGGAGRGGHQGARNAGAAAKGKAQPNLPEFSLGVQALPESRNIPGIMGTFSKNWVPYGTFATFQTFIPASSGMSLRIFGMFWSYRARQNAREFGIGFLGNSKGIFGEAVGEGASGAGVGRKGDAARGFGGRC
jgi:hypothetical protein